MKNKQNIIIVIIIVLIAIVLLWKFVFLKEKEIIFNMPSNYEIKVGDIEFIKYELSDNLPIIWESENTDIVKVSDGMITAVSLGNTVIKGTVQNNNKKVTRSATVTTYYGEKDVILNDFTVPDGELFITKGDTYVVPLNYEPENGYIKSGSFKSDNTNIVEYDGRLLAKEIGTTSITITINDSLSKSIIVNVVDEVMTPTFKNKATSVEVDNDNVVLKPSETITIDYTIKPENSYLKSVKWESSNESIATVDGGRIVAKSSGEAIIKLTINDEITKEIKVVVNIPVTGLNLLSNPRIVLKVGEQEKIKTSIIPANATDKTLKYESTGGVSVDNNGVVTGTAPSNGIITIKTVDGNYKQTISYVVNQRIGVVNNTGSIWGYSSPLDKVLTRADTSFFQRLASNGKGTLSGNIYYYSDSSHSYKYDISKSTLNYEGHNILMRFYYPAGVDLSEVNTFTFMGGSGERNLSGYISHLDKNREEMKSSGIVALVSAKENYNVKDAVGTTNFIKSIIEQKSDKKNTVGVYSMSGQAAGEAALSGLYNRIIIVNSYSSKISEFKNIDVIVFSPVGDSMLSNTKTTLTHLVRSNYNRVTVVSNNKDLYGNEFYNTKFLMINPGSQMGSGHGYVNISKAKVFSFANS